MRKIPRVRKIDYIATYSSLTADTMDHDFQTNCQLSQLWAKNRS